MKRAPKLSECSRHWWVTKPTPRRLIYILIAMTGRLAPLKIGFRFSRTALAAISANSNCGIHNPGTPEVVVQEDYDGDTFTLKLSQKSAPTPGQDEKAPQVIPVAVGLLNDNGDEVLSTQILELTEAGQSFAFPGHATRPVPSILRGFSAPVTLTHEIDNDRRAFLLAHDTDTFNRWEAGRDLARDSLLQSILKDAAPNATYLDGLKALLRDDSLDPAYRALMLGQPSQSELAATLHKMGQTPDPDTIHAASEALRDAKAQAFSDILPTLYSANQVKGPYLLTPVPQDNEALQRRAFITYTLGWRRDRRQTI